MSGNGRFYEPSGQVEPKGVLFIAVFGLIGADVLGVVYGYAQANIFRVYLRIAMPCLYGFSMGYLVALGARWGHIRNPRFSAAMALLFGVLAEYTGWVAWIYAITKQEILVFNPIQIINLAKEILKTGTWSLKGGIPVSGTVLAIFWIAEAIVIVSICVITALSKNKNPYCERCRKWINQHGYIHQLQYIADKEKFKTDILADLNCIKSFKKKKIGGILSGKDYTEAEITQCPNCKNFTLLSLSAIQIVVDRKDKENERKESLIQNLVVPPNILEIIGNLPSE